MADVTVTDAALNALVALIPDRNPERPAEDYLPALKAALAHAPPSEREAELEAQLKADHISLGEIIDSLRSQRDQLAAYADGLREALEEIGNDKAKTNAGTNVKTIWRHAESAKAALSSTPPQALAARDGEVLGLREALKSLINSHCEGFCKDFPEGFYQPDMSFDCSVCVARSALTHSKQAAKDAEDRILEKAAKRSRARTKGADDNG